MSLTRIDLKGTLSVETNCTQLIFNDTTGFKVTTCTCDENALGYGLTGGIALDDVTGAVLNVYYPGITTPIIFTFTIVNHVITAATLTDLNLVVTNILSLLDSTVFPLTEFDITLDYGVTLPEISDGLFEWDYTITGTSSAQAFSYTTSDVKLATCTTDCCIFNSYVDLDLSCGCLDDKINKIIKSEVFINAANYAAEINQNTKAVSFLDLSKEICDSNCKDC